ncbi:ornithine carbamoyltransferase [Actinomycetaceae bacterium L2_0104]
MNFQGRSFLKESDFTPGEWLAFIDLAEHLKAERGRGRQRQRLAGKSVALIFEKTSTRTRCAFEVAAFEQGAHTTYLDPVSSQIGHKESVADTARVLGRFYDAIEFRGDRQDDVEELAACAGVPVYNGLTDEWHPTQMLADALTIREHTGKPFSQVTHAYLGDGRFNMGRSLLVSSAMLGMDVRIVAPKEFQPDAEAIALAQTYAAETGAKVTVTDDVEAGVHGADVISTDIWVSMGEPKEAWTQRVAALRDYQVNRRLMDLTGNPEAIFMHCLPAFHDLNTVVGRDVFELTGMESLEVTDEVFESDRSVVFDQAENRMHTLKAVMVATLADPSEIPSFS